MTGIPDKQDNDVRLAVGEILGGMKHVVRQLDDVKSDFKDFRAEVRREQDNISERLNVVERFMWKSMGIAIAASTGIPIVITAVGYFFLGV